MAAAVGDVPVVVGFPELDGGRRYNALAVLRNGRVTQTYRKQNRGGKGKRGMATREEDVIEHVVNVSTHDFLLFFTNKGRVFRLKTYEVPAVGLNAKGIALVNLLQLQPEETVSSVINVSKQSQTGGGNLLMCTVRGVVKKTPFEQYQNVRQSGLIAINLDEGDELKWIRMTTGDNEVVISTQQGQAIRFRCDRVQHVHRGGAQRGIAARVRYGDQHGVAAAVRQCIDARDHDHRTAVVVH